MHGKCIHLGDCGGCSTQHIAYEEQLKAKQQGIEQLFPSWPVEPILPSPTIWGYRNKMEYTFSQDKAGKRFLGLFGRRGKVLTLSECHLAPDWYMEVKQAVFDWWGEENVPAFRPPTGEGLLINLILRSSLKTGGKMINLVVSGDPTYALSGAALDRFVAAVLARLEPKEGVSIFLTLKHAKKGVPTSYSEMHLHGPTHLEYILGERMLHVSPSSFFQPNDYTASILCETALKMVAPSPEETLIDLFCGLGTLGLYFAPHVKEVVGVEINKAAVSDARDNAAREELDNALFFADDVSSFVKDYAGAFDIAIVDPPRVGLEERGVKALLTLRPKKLLYISCNPKTQALDLPHFLPYYRVEKIQPLDQFPHTAHVENLLLLHLL